MTTTANYASIPKTGAVTVSTANTARDGSGTLGVIATATATAASGTRYDKIVTQATGTTTAGMMRFYITKGVPGIAITSITFVGTTATVTTSASHGRTTGDKITLQGAFPDNYNVTDTAITVTGATTFTYTMGTAPTINASTLGSYSSTTASPTSYLWREVPVTAITPSGSVQAFTNTMSSTSSADQGYLPLILQAGYSLRCAPNNAETFNVIALNSGDFA